MPAFSGLDLKIVCVKIFFHDCVPGSVWFFFNRSWIQIGFFQTLDLWLSSGYRTINWFWYKDFGRCGLPLGNWTVGGFLSYWIPGFRMDLGL